MDKFGYPFWSGSKRFPTASAFDPSDPLAVQFVASAANLVAFGLGIPQERDLEKIARQAAEVPVKPFVPKRILTEEEGGSKKEASPEDEEVIRSIA